MQILLHVMLILPDFPRQFVLGNKTADVFAFGSLSAAPFIDNGNLA
jgi:hypothetical protein